VVQFLSYERIYLFFREVFNLEISRGSMVNRYCNKRLDWAWIAQTVYFTQVFRASGRASKELEDCFGDSLERMTAVTDRHNAYFALHFLNHQVCLAHLLRECQCLSELDKEQTWSKSIESLFQEPIHERKK